MNIEVYHVKSVNCWTFRVHFLSLLEVSLKNAVEENFVSFVSLIKRFSILASLEM
jgi:hypothetical protein